MKIKNCLSCILFIQIIALSVYASILHIDPKSTAILLIFNFIFITLTWRLKGEACRKIGLLAVGNLLGLLWNYVFYTFAVESAVLFGDGFSKLYLIFYPFLSSLWIVTFWSLSLTVLPKPKALPAERPYLDY
jgi:hypothetical protein